MRTVKIQVSLCIRTAWFANLIVHRHTYETLFYRTADGVDIMHAHTKLKLHCPHISKGIFLHDVPL